MSRSRVEKNATKPAAAAAAISPNSSASQIEGGDTASSAAAAPYMPSPKNAEWQHERCGRQQPDNNGKAEPKDQGRAAAHRTAVANSPVGRNNRVRISTTNDTMTACAGLTHNAA